MTLDEPRRDSRRWPPAATLVETCRVWVVLLLVGFAVNVVWEFTQAPLYEGGSELPATIYLRASATDAVLIAAATALGLVARRRSRLAFWAILVGALAVTAAFIELRAVMLGRWSYSPLMPTVGMVGLAPQVQLPLLGALTAWLTQPWRAWPLVPTQRRVGGDEAISGAGRAGGRGPVPDG